MRHSGMECRPCRLNRDFRDKGENGGHYAQNGERTKTLEEAKDRRDNACARETTTTCDGCADSKSV